MFLSNSGPFNTGNINQGAEMTEATKSEGLCNGPCENKHDNVKFELEYFCLYFTIGKAAVC